MGKLKYWHCQVGGWSLMALINTPFVLFKEGTWRHLLVLYSIMTFGAGLSHIYRKRIKQRRWTELPLKNLLPRVLGANCLMGVCLMFIAMIIHMALIEPDPDHSPLFAAGVMFFNFSSLFFSWSLIYFAVHYFKNFKNAEIEKWQLEAKVKEAELQALKAQLNPHFLFNMLNSIRALITEDPERAQRVVTRVARVLRTSLQGGEQTLVSLNKELETVRDYLELESIRLEERLTWKITSAPETVNMPVPSMLLQTLVENGVKHGVAALPEGGEIHIETRKKGAHLEILVANHGQISETHSGTGIGLKNTRERLHLHYGTQASLTLKNLSSNKVMAQVSIPWGLAG